MYRKKRKEIRICPQLSQRLKWKVLQEKHLVTSQRVRSSRRKPHSQCPVTTPKGLAIPVVQSSYSSSEQFVASIEYSILFYKMENNYTRIRNLTELSLSWISFFVFSVHFFVNYNYKHSICICWMYK